MRAGGIELLHEGDGRPITAVIARHRGVDIRYPALDVHRLQLCLGGRLAGTQRVDGHGGPVAYRALPGALHFVPAGRGSHVRDTGAALCLHLLIEREAMDEAVARLAADEGVERSPPAAFAALVDETLHGCLLPIRHALTAPGPGGARRLELFGRAACVGILGVAARPVPGASVRRERLSAASLALAMATLEDEAVAGAGLVAVARAVGFSPHHFARAFRNTTGVSPYRHVSRRRVERAMAMLADSDVSIADVAKACGYSSQAHMTSAFRRHTGTTPARYRAARR